MKQNQIYQIIFYHTFVLLVKTWRPRYPQCSSPAHNSVRDSCILLIVANVDSSRQADGGCVTEGS